MGERAWLHQGVDSRRPTDARVYDYALGGKDNYAVDRRFADRLVAVAPESRLIAAENSRFARRAVRRLIREGVRQFLDLGCGMPKRANVHDLAGPESRVVYVDYDPVAVTHYQATLARGSSAAVVHADVRRPDHVLADPAVTGLIDFDRPVALLITFVLHLIDDGEDPAGILRAYRDALSPGSHLVLSHLATDEMPPAVLDEVHEIADDLREPVTLRASEEIRAFFDGFTLLDPGLVPAPDWCPDRPYRTPTGWVLAGVGRKD